MHTLQIQLLTPEAKMPTYAHPGDAAFDIYTTEAQTLFPGQRHTFKTGVASAFSPRFFLWAADKSGLAHHSGLTLLGGIIDSGYRGEWGIILLNTSKYSIAIEKGDKIAQGIMLPVPQFRLKQVTRLKASLRNKGGFGSTGR